jgi:hypothetical protein
VYCDVIEGWLLNCIHVFPFRYFHYVLIKHFVNYVDLLTIKFRLNQFLN